jgi:hypothetical protein
MYLTSDLTARSSWGSFFFFFAASAPVGRWTRRRRERRRRVTSDRIDREFIVGGWGARGVLCWGIAIGSLF